MKQTEIALIPEDWKIAKLYDVMEEVNIRVKHLNTIDAEQVPILSLTKNYGLIPQFQRFHKRIATKDVSNYKVIRKWQAVYNPYVIWEGAIHTLRKMDIGMVSPVYIVWKFKDNVDPSFMDYQLRTPLLLNRYLSRASGVVNRRRSISKTDFLNIPILLPPLHEQQKIAKVLDTIQRAIEIQDRIIETTKNLKKSLMQKLFHEGTKGEELKETEIGLIPKSWEVVRLGDDNILIQTQYGLSVKGQQSGKYPIIRMNNLQNGQIWINDLQFVDIDDKTFCKFKLNKGDILFNRTNSLELVGKASIFNLEEDFVFASYLIRLKTNSSILDPYFFNHYFNWGITQYRLKGLASRGVSQANISATKLKTFKIPLPPLPEQQEIANILSTIDRKIEIEQRGKDLLKQLFKTMLHKLMSGEIRLKDVKI